MFKGNKKYIFIFIGLFIAIVALQYLLPKPVNWSRTYLNRDKIPFGCYAIYNLIEGTFSDKLINNNQTLYNLKDKLTGNSSVVFINKNINLNKSDVRSLYQILEQGNTVLIAANSFEGLIADTFHLETRYVFFEHFSSIDSLLNKPGDKINLTAGNQKNKMYQYSRAAMVSAFENFDSTRFHIKATTDGNQACLIEAKVGKGRLLLMSAPDIFTNYFIVNNSNRYLAYAILSSVKNKEIVWDQYYKSFNVSKDSFLKFILQNDSLYTAYLLLIFTILFYMIFEGRRRQRAIPIIEPVKNNTLEFVNVLTHVYYNNRNHLDIATERIKYFYENIRKKFNVRTDDINDAFIREITDLSGVDFKIVRQLFSYCEKLKKAHEITEYDLIELNRQITNFNKTSLR